MPSPNLIGSILARQTKRVKIAVVGNALPLYNPPTRVAEEFAMIDVISGGRLIAGMVVGGGPEYYANSINPTHARAKFSEALDLIMQAWTRPGPFTFNGKHYKLRYVNPWPRAAAEAAPADLDSRRRQPGDDGVLRQAPLRVHGHSLLSHRVFQRNFDFFREACEKEGYTPDPGADGLAAPDLRRRDRRAGLGGVRAAPLLLRPEAARGHRRLPAGLHQRQVDRCASRSRAATS